MLRRQFVSSAMIASTLPSVASAKNSTLSENYSDAAHRLIEAGMASAGAWEKLLHLCDRIGARLSGSVALERAIEWAENALISEGLENVQLQEVAVPHFVRGDERCAMTAPYEKPIALLGLGRSIATPPAGIQGEVLTVSSFEEFSSLPNESARGKIVVWNAPFTTYGETVQYRSRGAIEAARKGAIASLVRSIGPNSLYTPHTGVMSHYDSDVPAIPAAAITIEDAELMARLQTQGVSVRLNLYMEADTLPDAQSHNVIAEIEGREKPEEIVVLGGHIDSWDVGQGAHDDGGGVVACMEAMRLIASLGLRPRRTLRLVLWTNEENGAAGARAYRESLGDELERHVAAFESDIGMERLLGFGVTIRRAGSYAVDAQRQESAMKTLGEIAGLLKPLGAEEVFDQGFGVDIAPLMAAGIPGLSIHTPMELYWDIHHTHADTVEKIDPDVIRKHAAAYAVSLYCIADMPQRFGE